MFVCVFKVCFPLRPQFLFLNIFLIKFYMEELVSNVEMTY